jgi:dTDP-4-dehydrorhamnose reductase
MSVSRLLLVGRGHLGTFLRQRWALSPEFHWTGEMADLPDEVLLRLQPTAVVNVAGKTDLPWCEENAREAFRCNVEAPLGVYRKVRKVLGPRATYVQLSSGCIWDGPYHPDGRAFRPSDPPSPACFYSWTKSACDALLQSEADTPVLILRPRQLFSPLPFARNTLMKLKQYPRLLDTPNSMTSAETVARTIEAALAVSPSEQRTRVFGVYDRGITSPFEVGCLLHEAGLRDAPTKLSKSDLDTWHKPRRVDVVLEDPSFEELVRPSTVQDRLRSDIAALARNLATPST